MMTEQEHFRHVNQVFKSFPSLLGMILSQQKCNFDLFYLRMQDKDNDIFSLFFFFFFKLPSKTKIWQKKKKKNCISGSQFNAISSPSL